MNDYNKYKFMKFLDVSLDKFFAFMFYIPRKSYKANGRFKKWIDGIGSKKYKKNEFKRIMNKIFYILNTMKIKNVWC